MFKAKFFFGFFVLPFFPEKAQNKKQSRDQSDLLINDENT
jgi:hypothetical protein